MNLNELKKQYKQLLDEANRKMAEYKDQILPKEIAEEIDRLLGKSDELRLQIERMSKLEQHNFYSQESEGTKAAFLDWRPAGANEGMAEVDTKSWQDVAVETIAINPVLGLPVNETKTLRVFVPLAVQQKGYASAFEAYCRKGFSELGATDRKILNEGVDSAGGFLVPEEFQITLIKKIATLTTIRANARVVTTSRDVSQWPAIKYEADDRYTSGVRMTWTGELPATAEAHRVTNPVFGLHTVSAHTAMASLPISNDMLEDSAFDVVGIASDLLAEAFALGENEAFITGNGSGRPLGILSAIGTDVGSQIIPSGHASTLTADGLIDLVYSLPAQYETNAKIFMNKSTERAIRKLKTSTNEYIYPITSQVGNLGAVPRELLGFPVVREEFLPDVAANSFPIVFGDMRGYLIMDRVGFSLQRLSELYAERNVSVLLARKRVGGQPVEPWRLKIQRVSAS